MKGLLTDKRRAVRGALVLGGLAVAGLWLAAGSRHEAGKESAQAAPKPALTARAVKLTPSQMTQAIRANGSVMAWQEAVIGAELPGLRIAEVKASVGDRVHRGDVLAQLSSDTPQAAEAESQAALLESEARHAEAKANAERMRKLAASGFISEQQAIQANMAEEAARARMEAQRARHRADTVRLSQTRIVAPDDGVISSASATVGTLTQNGVELFRLIRKGRLEWRADLTAAELARVRPGMAVAVQAGAATVTGKVRAVAPAVSAKTLYGQVLVDLPADAPLIAGQFARGEISLGVTRSDAPALPLSAVLMRGEVASVFVIGADSKVQERQIGVGHRSGDRIEVVSGLEPEAAVVESGAAFLTSGDVVQVVKDK